jgi:uncharacterized protein (DUF1697 family)
LKISNAYVALLRGVNVGGKNTLPMKALSDIFGEAGCGAVRTYIQSGNVIFTASTGISNRLPGLVSARIAKRFGYKTRVIIRTADEFAGAVRKNPFLKSGAEEGSLHLMFLAGLPDPRNVRDLDPDRSPPDSYIVRGREVYLRLPNGVARTKLTNAYFDAKLATTGTQRSWRTVLNLLDMLKG